MNRYRVKIAHTLQRSATLPPTVEYVYEQEATYCEKAVRAALERFFEHYRVDGRIMIGGDRIELAVAELTGGVE
jgi:hypothetical protein